MPPSTQLRPLFVDVVVFLTPLIIGAFAFYLGRFFHRWSIAVRAALIVLTVSAVGLAWALLFHAMPKPVEQAFSYFGGVTVVLCWMILGVIGISWSSPNPSWDFLFRAALSVAPLALIGVEAGGSLWFRFNAPEVWQNRTRESGLLTQTTKMTCLPVSAAMLLHLYGFDDASEGELAYLANTSYFGTDNHVMARVLTRKIGRRNVRAVAIKTDYDAMTERGMPFIAQVQLENVGNHAVLIKKATPHTVVWVDPLAGFEQHISPTLFQQVWTGTAIVIEGMDPRPDPERP